LRPAFFLGSTRAIPPIRINIKQNGRIHRLRIIAQLNNGFCDITQLLNLYDKLSSCHSVFVMNFVMPAQGHADDGKIGAYQKGIITTKQSAAAY
jgi:hypothetical protein